MSAEVRREFAAKVAALGRGRTMAEDFTPKKVVYAGVVEHSVYVDPPPAARASAAACWRP